MTINFYWHKRMYSKSVPSITVRPEDSPGGRVQCLAVTWLWRSLQIRWWA